MTWSLWTALSLGSVIEAIYQKLFTWINSHLDRESCRVVIMSSDMSQSETKFDSLWSFWHAGLLDKECLRQFSICIRNSEKDCEKRKRNFYCNSRLLSTFINGSKNRCILVTKRPNYLFSLPCANRS